MNINKIKNKYPFKKTEAKITAILYHNEESRWVTVYDSYDAEEELSRETDSFGRIDEQRIKEKVFEYSRYDFFLKYEEDFWGNPVVKENKIMHDYKLQVEYKDLSEQIHHGTIEISSETQFSTGDPITVCYLIDNPDEVSLDSGKQTIDDYLVFRMFGIIVLVVTLILLVILLLEHYIF